jgi:hypothetical protein
MTGVPWGLSERVRVARMAGLMSLEKGECEGECEGEEEDVSVRENMRMPREREHKMRCDPEGVTLSGSAVSVESQREKKKEGPTDR